MSKVIFWSALVGEWGGRDPFLNNHNQYWFQIENYTKLQFYYCGFNGEGKIKRTDFHKIRLWLESNIEGEVIMKYNDSRNSGHLTIDAYFQIEGDAVAFKLVWLGDTI
ncbi:MAG: hypothetical protein HC836_22785 [Richelia sp. RM2_1_2]|nr:hypothetical protein [Richelia sp. RM2_1_2]